MSIVNETIARNAVGFGDTKIAYIPVEMFGIYPCYEVIDFFANDDLNQISNPTHWMPIPDIITK